MQDQAEHWGFLAAADGMLDACLRQILTEPNITVPRGKDPGAWLQERHAVLAEMAPEALNGAVLRREPAWQVGSLIQLCRERLIRQFNVRVDEGRLTLMIDPLAPGRVVQIGVASEGRPAAAPRLN